MCGIAGIVDLRARETVSHTLLRRMAAAQAHRGPDDEGLYVDRFVGLAHRRLAIIDPTPAGHQPMVSPDGQVAVVFNGTIFNFQELRTLLQAAGHPFSSRCDTEVLVHGWREWGQGLVERLNGHFAFVIWDAGRGLVHMVRDRFGTKPLYYANLGGLWLLASEIKAILTHPAYSLEINHDALCEYFTFQNLFRFHTLFKGIYLVPPANIFTIDTNSGHHYRRSFWDYDFSSPEESMGLAEAQEMTRHYLTQAVRRQLVADVPVGAYLSGGIDSGSIVAISSQELPRLHTFTCGWHMGGVEGLEASFDERAKAEMMSYHFGTEHYEQVLGFGDMGWVMSRLIYHLEDLRLGMSYGNYYIARLASKFVKVCLAGTGGDEIFGGYPWRYYRVARCLGRGEFVQSYYDYWQRLIPDDLRPDFFTPETLSAMQDRDMKGVLERVFRFHPGIRFQRPEDHIANSLYFEVKTFLHGLLLLGDKLSMAHGLEERFPFLDNDLVDFAQKVPVRYKLRELDRWERQDENSLGRKKAHYARHNDGKNVLRQAVAPWLPQEISLAQKQGFSSPDESWYRGPSLHLVKSILLNRHALCHAYIERKQIQRILEEHCLQRINHRLRIWSLLCFEYWLAIFLDNRPQLAAGPGLPAARSWAVPPGHAPADAPALPGRQEPVMPLALAAAREGRGWLGAAH